VLASENRVIPETNKQKKNAAMYAEVNAGMESERYLQEWWVD